jgi:hypothetical protein
MSVFKEIKASTVKPLNLLYYIKYRYYIKKCFRQDKATLLDTRKEFYNIYYHCCSITAVTWLLLQFNYTFLPRFFFFDAYSFSSLLIATYFLLFDAYRVSNFLFTTLFLLFIFTPFLPILIDTSFLLL